jgi:alpha-tubulin suppressor-like RCC1 family protein
VKVADLPTDIIAVAAGVMHSLALTSKGTVYAWGNNQAGQLGDGTTTNRSTPVKVADLPTDITAVAAGAVHTLAMNSKGTVYAWGDNSEGQLGDGTTTSSLTPKPVSLPADVTITTVAAGYGHNLAATATGTVYAWGQNHYGQLGSGASNEFSSTPVAVLVLPAGATITALSGSSMHSLAAASNGTAYAWGQNAPFGLLGDGTTTNHPTPVAISLPAGVTFKALAAGVYHNLAVGSNGTAYVWGTNTDGQLGDGTSDLESILAPAAVKGLPTGVTVTAVAAGGGHSLVAVSTTAPTVR